MRIFFIEPKFKQEFYPLIYYKRVQYERENERNCSTYLRVKETF